VFPDKVTHGKQHLPARIVAMQETTAHKPGDRRLHIRASLLHDPESPSLLLTSAIKPWNLPVE
jgi:hypothetical protein